MANAHQYLQEDLQDSKRRSQVSFQKKHFDFKKKNNTERGIRQVLRLSSSKHHHKKGLFSSFLKTTRDELFSNAHSFS